MDKECLSDFLALCVRTEDQARELILAAGWGGLLGSGIIALSLLGAAVELRRRRSRGSAPTQGPFR